MSATIPRSSPPRLSSMIEALAWNFFRHGWMNFAGGLLLLCGIPALLFTSIWFFEPQIAQVLREEPTHLKWIFFALELGVLPLMALLEAGRVRPLYTLPLSSRQITNLQLLLAVVAVCLLHLLTVAFYRVLFQAPIPIGGPLLFLVPATLALAGTGALWGDFRWWRPWLILGGLGWLMVRWDRTRFNQVVTDSPAWYTPTTREFVTLALLGLGGYAFALHGLQRDRTGELRPWPDLDVLLRQLTEQARRLWTPRSFRTGTPSPVGAHFWFEWINRGIALPLCTLLAVGILCLPMVEDATEFFSAMVTIVPVLLLMLGGFAGFVTGLVHTSDNDWRLHPFRATRPLTDTQLAYCTLQVAVVGQLAALLVVAVAVVAMVAASAWFEPVDLPMVAATLRDTYRPSPPASAALTPWISFGLACLAAVVGNWVVLGGVVSLLLTGSRRLFGGAIATLFALLFAMLALQRWQESVDAERTAFPALIALLSGCALLFAAWVFPQALRRGLITQKTVLMCAAGWLATAALLLAVLAAYGQLNGPTACILGGLAVLVVTPFAATPLAISFNRHR